MQQDTETFLAKFLTREAAAARAGVSAQTIRNWIGRGLIPLTKLGYAARVNADALDAFLKNRVKDTQREVLRQSAVTEQRRQKQEEVSHNAV